MPFLELKNVSKGYGTNGTRSEVLSDINLSMEKGEFVAIVGYSGAGKTTLMSLLAGLAKPDSGSVMLPVSALIKPAIMEISVVLPAPE